MHFLFNPVAGRANSRSGATLVVLLPILVTATIGGASMSRLAAQNSPEPAAPPSLQFSVNGYGNRDSHCLAWNDGCVTCRRDTEAGAICSNIGIACQPKEVACTQRQAEPAK
jgi:hypothetical protein